MNKELGTVIFGILVVLHVASIIYGFIKLIPNKQLPLGAKLIFGLMFFGLPFVGLAVFNLISKHWDKLMAPKVAKDVKPNSK